MPSTSPPAKTSDAPSATPGSSKASNLIIGISGSREFGSPGLIKSFIKSVALKHPDAIICQGKARGVDSWAREAAIAANLWVIDVPVEREHWDHHGKVAGHRRNAIIAHMSDILVAFWNGKSPGTKDCIKSALLLEKRVRVVLSDGKIFDDPNHIKELVR